MVRRVNNARSWLVLISVVLLNGQPLSAQNCERPREGIGRPKIVGGLMADSRDWPWQVVLRTHKPADGSFFYFCGATIVGPTTVLTAAHCVADLKSGGDGWVDEEGSVLEAVIGVSDLKRVTSEQVRLVRGVRVHEIYAAAFSKYGDKTAQTVGDDIAVLTLASPWKGRYARLSLSPETDPRTPPGALLAVAGFGLQVAEKLGGKVIAYKQSGGTPFAAGSDRLQEVGIDLISDATCIASYGGGRLPAGQMCAGSEFGGHDSCSGDSGGPLVMFDHEGCTYQVGVVSSGPEDCAQSHAYGLYTRLSEFADWIHRNVPEATVAQAQIATRDDTFAPLDAVETTQAQLRDLIGSDGERAEVRIREGSNLKLGSTLTLEVSSRIAGVLLLVDVDASGQVTQLYPNAFSRGRTIAAGQTLVIDGSEAGFVFRAHEPTGQGRVIAVVGPPALEATALIGKEARTKGIVAEEAPVSYLSQLVQLVGRERRGAASASDPSNWALATTNYVISK